jgi:hypothetical protein
MAEQRVTVRQKRAVMERANNCCEYCHAPEPYAPDAFAIEHIVPRVLGGSTSLDNLALSCQGCNGHKYAKMEGLDPLTNSICPLFHPRQHVWREHFTWNEDFTEIVGSTPVGRTTVATLQMNRAKLVNFRRILYVAGKPPPE